MKTLDFLIVLTIMMIGIFVSFELKRLRDEVKYITHAITMLNSDLFILMKPQKDDKNENT
jgi:hypothetical protein